MNPKLFKTISFTNTFFTHLLSISLRHSSVTSRNTSFFVAHHQRRNCHHSTNISKRINLLSCRGGNSYYYFHSKTKVAMTTPLSNNVTSSFSSHLKDVLSIHLPSILTESTRTNHNEEDTGTDAGISSAIKKVNVVMGNEAGDADSIISSLALSYVKNIDKHRHKQEISIPLISINKEDIALRRDVVLLLQLAGIYNLEEMLYLDDSRLQSILNNNNDGNSDTSITLVDHNKLRSDLWDLENYVHEIIDHHHDEGFHTSSTKIRNIAFEDQKASVGSTCTLVTERLIQQQNMSNNNNHGGDKDKQLKIDAQLGISLLGVILLDTMNMNPDAGKGMKRDEDAIQALIENSDWNQLADDVKDMIMVKSEDDSIQPDRVKLFEYLQNSKFDRSFWNEMSARDILRIDYKRFESSQSTFGLSSVLLGANDVIMKQCFYDIAKKYIKEMNIDFLGVLCMLIVDDKPEREIILIGDKEKIYDLSKYLVKDEATAFLDISLVQDVSDNSDKCTDDIILKRFRQGNPKGSRKQVAPVIRSFYSK